MQGVLLVDVFQLFMSILSQRIPGLNVLLRQDLLEAEHPLLLSVLFFYDSEDSTERN